MDILTNTDPKSIDPLNLDIFINAFKDSQTTKCGHFIKYFSNIYEPKKVDIITIIFKGPTDYETRIF